MPLVNGFVNIGLPHLLFRLPSCRGPGRTPPARPREGREGLDFLGCHFRARMSGRLWEQKRIVRDDLDLRREIACRGLHPMSEVATSALTTPAAVPDQPLLEAATSAWWCVTDRLRKCEYPTAPGWQAADAGGSRLLQCFSSVLVQITVSASTSRCSSNVLPRQNQT